MNTKERVIELAKYAYLHVPFYHDLYKKNGIVPYDGMNIEELPIVKKIDIVKNASLMISDMYRMDELEQSYTSGTSGLQVSTYNTKEEQIERALILWKEREKNCPHIMKENKVIFHDGGMAQLPVMFQDGMLYLSKENLCDQTFHSYIEELNKYQSGFLRCNSSVLFEFMRYMQRTSQRLNYDIKYIELAGEFVPDNVYKSICEFFDQTVVINYYGAYEFYSIAHGCKNNHLHETEESVYVEVINPDENGFGNYIITSLINRAMPLIRYDIGDIGNIVENTCDCGKKGRILNIQSGRTCEFYQDINKKVPAYFFARMLMDYADVIDSNFLVQFHVIQSRIDLLEYYIEVNTPISEDALTEFLKEKINKHLNRHTDVKVFVVEDMAKWVTSHKYKMYDFM